MILMTEEDERKVASPSSPVNLEPYNKGGRVEGGKKKEDLRRESVQRKCRKGKVTSDG